MTGDPWRTVIFREPPALPDEHDNLDDDEEDR